jgi:hypothetical protein
MGMPPPKAGYEDGCGFAYVFPPRDPVNKSHAPRLRARGAQPDNTVRPDLAAGQMQVSCAVLLPDAGSAAC